MSLDEALSVDPEVVVGIGRSDFSLWARKSLKQGHVDPSERAWLTQMGMFHTDRVVVPDYPFTREQEKKRKEGRLSARKLAGPASKSPKGSKTPASASGAEMAWSQPGGGVLEGSEGRGRRPGRIPTSPDQGEDVTPWDDMNPGEIGGRPKEYVWRAYPAGSKMDKMDLPRRSSATSSRAVVRSVSSSKLRATTGGGKPKAKT